MKRNLFLGLFATFLTLGAFDAVQAQTPTVSTVDLAKVEQYKSLMEINGTSRNIRDVVHRTRDVAREEISLRTGKQTFTAEETQRFDAIADPIFKTAENDIIDMVARAQSAPFSSAELQSLITSNSGVAAAKYNAAKFSDSQGMTQKIQTLMVDTVVAIIQIYKGNESGDLTLPPYLSSRLAAAEPAQFVHIQTVDAFETRRKLARQLLKVDGTDSVLRKYISSSHMSLILDEVAKYIDFNALSEDDKTRLVAIVANQQSKLEENIIDLQAIAQAENLREPELKQLIAAFDTPAQQKLTSIRLNDNGELDKQSQTILQIAAIKTVEQYLAK